MSKRIEKVNKLVKEIVARAVEVELAGSGAGLVTVTAVETTPDLKHAVVWVSILSDETANSFERLQVVRDNVQRTLAANIEMRFTPRISFKLDESYKNVERVSELLKDQES